MRNCSLATGASRPESGSFVREILQFPPAARMGGGRSVAQAHYWKGNHNQMVRDLRLEESPGP